MRSKSWLCHFNNKSSEGPIDACTGYRLIMGHCLQEVNVYLWTWKILNDCIFDCNLMPLLCWITHEYGDLSGQLWEPTVHYPSCQESCDQNILKLYPGPSCLFLGNVFKTLVSAKRLNNFIIKTGEHKTLEKSSTMSIVFVEVPVPKPSP